jgi:hypothetical protein
VITFLVGKGLLPPARAVMLRGWAHSGFNVYRSRRVAPEERADLERLAQYIIRNPFARLRHRSGPDLRERLNLRDRSGLSRFTLPDDKSAPAGRSWNTPPGPQGRVGVYWTSFPASGRLFTTNALLPTGFCGPVPVSARKRFLTTGVCNDAKRWCSTPWLGVHRSSHRVICASIGRIDKKGSMYPSISRNAHTNSTARARMIAWESAELRTFVEMLTAHPARHRKQQTCGHQGQPTTRLVRTGRHFPSSASRYTLTIRPSRRGVTHATNALSTAKTAK